MLQTLRSLPLSLVFACWAAALFGCRSTPEALPDPEVHFTQVGHGDDVLVLVHGWASDGSVFDAQVRALSDEARLLVVDLPGHGQSPMPQEPWSMALFARGVRYAMDQAGIEEAVLVGHSNGVPVVREFWRMFPDRVRGLVLLDGALEPMIGAEMAEGFMALYREPGYEDRAESLADQMLATIPEELRPPLREMMLATSPETLAGGIEAVVDPSIWTDDRIETPTLAILAQQPMWSAEYLARIPEIVPEIELHVWEGVSHYLHVGQAERFHQVLRPFLHDRVGFH